MSKQVKREIFVLGVHLASALRCVSTVYQAKDAEGEYSLDEMNELIEFLETERGSALRNEIDNMCCFMNQISLRISGKGLC